MGAPAEAQFDSMMKKAFSLQPFSNSCFDEQINGVLFEETRPYALFAILSAARFNYDGLDALQMQQV
jgi:hypothetical protein